MSELKATGVIILFFALRCIAPLVITLGVGYLMNRLVDRWEAEEAAFKTGEKGVLEPVEPVLPATKVANAGASPIPCWLLRNCDEQKRAHCPAYLEQSLPCWIARLISDGALPESCPDCPIYDPRLALS